MRDFGVSVVLRRLFEGCGGGTVDSRWEMYST